MGAFPIWDPWGRKEVENPKGPIGWPQWTNTHQRTMKDEW